MNKYPTVVFGGAFDPVHFGHIKPILELAKCLEAAQIRFLPCYKHPDKTLIASAMHRLAMLRLIVRSPQMIVDTYELDQKDVCYTVDTLIGLRQTLGAECPLCFVLGQDAFIQIEEWQQYQRIPDLAHLIVMTRTGFDCFDTHPLLKRCGGWSQLVALNDAPAGKLCMFNNHPIGVSSTNVRECVARGEQPKYLLPGVVWNYIQRHQLYSALH